MEEERRTRMPSSEVWVENTKDISTLSDAQEMALSLLPIPSTILSIIGSCIIIHLVVNAKPSQRGPYMRILLGMSICDAITSLAWALQGFVMPAATSQRVWAFGNDVSCTLIGFLTQFAFSSFIYYGMLSYYYLLTIRYGMRDAKIAKYIEPCMHVVSVGYPLITAIVGASAGMFAENELGMGCWVNQYPHNCGYDPGETGMECQSPLIAWIMGGSVILFILASLLVTNIIIYLHVRNTINRARRFVPNFQQSTPRNNNNNNNSNFQSATSSDDMAAAAAAATTTTTASTTFRSSPWNRLSRQSTTKNNNNNNADNQTRRVRAVAAQCFLYVFAFVLCYTWTMVIRILEGSVNLSAQDEASIYYLLVGQAIFGPLTGWLNLIIYLRPRYLRCRKDFAQESRWWAAKRALFGDSVQRTAATATPSRRNNTTGRAGRSGAATRSSGTTSAVSVSGTTNTINHNRCSSSQADSTSPPQWLQSTRRGGRPSEFCLNTNTAARPREQSTMVSTTTVCPNNSNDLLALPPPVASSSSSSSGAAAEEQAPPKRFETISGVGSTSSLPPPPAAAAATAATTTTATAHSSDSIECDLCQEPHDQDQQQQQQPQQQQP